LNSAAQTGRSRSNVKDSNESRNKSGRNQEKKSEQPGSLTHKQPKMDRIFPQENLGKSALIETSSGSFIISIEKQINEKAHKKVQTRDHDDDRD
jgi:hypothetical protein